MSGVYLPDDVRRPMQGRTIDLYNKYQLFFNMSQQRRSDFFAILDHDETVLITDLMIYNIYGGNFIRHWINKLPREKLDMLESIYENKLSQPGLYGRKRKNSKKRKTNRRKSRVVRK